MEAATLAITSSGSAAVPGCFFAWCGSAMARKMTEARLKQRRSSLGDRMDAFKQRQAMLAATQAHEGNTLHRAMGKFKRAQMKLRITSAFGGLTGVKGMGSRMASLKKRQEEAAKSARGGADKRQPTQRKRSAPAGLAGSEGAE